jgi:hypothetical protein
MAKDRTYTTARHITDKESSERKVTVSTDEEGRKHTTDHHIYNDT